MHDAIAACLHRLLFEHDSVSVQGLGSFIATRKSAQADFGVSAVMPPSRTLSFNENLQTDDGLLAAELARSGSLSQTEAQRHIREFVAQTQARLDQRDIVSIQGIGRLYKNYMGQVQFLPDANNFSAEYFGLPNLQFSPLSRMQADPDSAPAQTAESAAAPAPTYTTAQPDDSGARMGGVLRGLLIGLLVLLALAAAYWFWKNKQETPSAPSTPDPTETIADEPANTSPKPAQPAPQTPPPNPQASAPTPQTPPPAAKPSRTVPAPAKPEPRTSDAQGARKCVIVIATLQDESNAERLKNLLVEQGYDLYYLRQKGHQVGIQFAYNDAFDIQTKLRELEQLTGERNMWIKQK